MKKTVTMRTTAAGPAGVFLAGQTYSVPGELAKDWLAGGYAQTAKGGPPSSPAQPETEISSSADVLAVPCPACEALVGEPCRTPSGGEASKPHVGRIREAETAAED